MLERPSFTEIIAKLVMGAPGEIVLPQVELEEVKPKEEKKPTGKSPAREVKEKAEPRESDLEAQYDAVPNSEGNHLTLSKTRLLRFLVKPIWISLPPERISWRSTSTG